MSERRKYRAGDVVRHIELGEEWLLACDEWADRVCACGWPPSWNQATEVELVTPATDEERLATLRATAAMGCSVRSAQAQASLDAEPKPRRTLADVVANPPDGWTVTELPTGDPAEPLYRFEISREVIVLFEPADRDDPVEVLVSECTTLAKAASHVRAVAELLVLLGEVPHV